MRQQSKPAGALVVSVDLSNEYDPRMSSRLLSLFRARQIPVTWSHREPATAPYAESILGAEVNHEIALLCDPAWAGNGAGRTTFARQLRRRLAAAEQAGICISTLTMRSADLTDNLDLLVKHRISVVRGRLDPQRSHAAFVQPKSLRFGVWYAPVSRVLPAQARWTTWAANWLWRKNIQHACRQLGYFHLAVDLVHMNGHDLKQLENASNAAARLRDEGSLSIQTLKQLSQRLSRKRTQPPAQSVLRRLTGQRPINPTRERCSS